jgi:arylsulfatase A-like enzyme
MTIRFPFGIACLIAFTTSGTHCAIAADKKPNIVIIVGDDMGYADVGVHGCKDIPTPNLDALAAAGTRCTSGYVSGPYCSPTRAGLLTGRYQTRFGHEYNPGNGGGRRRTADAASAKRKAAEEERAANDRVGLPVTETTVADRLKSAGYATGLVGKWHLGSAPQFHPQRRGFDEFFGFLGGAHSYFPGSRILRGTEPVEDKEYLTDALGREGVSFIERHADKPFFLYLAFNAVHTPMHATDARLAKFKNIPEPSRRTYAAMMSAMDDAIGKVLEALRAKQLEENTLVFFISDNGGPTLAGTTVNASLNDPLRGSKRTTLEGGIRVPYFVCWPGHVPAGKTYDRPVIQLDILPTALAAAGIIAGVDAKLEGVDLLPYLAGQNAAAPHDALYWRWGPQMAIRRGDWKLVRYDPAADGKTGRVTEPKLYNLKNDIGETLNVIGAEPDKAKELQTAWDEWNKLNVAPLWGGGQRNAIGLRNRAGRGKKAAE